jgi:hypothetical protein
VGVSASEPAGWGKASTDGTYRTHGTYVFDPIGRICPIGPIRRLAQRVFKRFLFGSARSEMTERSIDSVHLLKLLSL